MMVAHPTLSTTEVEKIVDYILSLKLEAAANEKSLPLKGTVTFNQHKTTDKNGVYILTTSYRDKGKNGLDNAELTGRKQVFFKAPYYEAQKVDEKSEGLGDWNAAKIPLVGSIKHDSYLKCNSVDLTGLKSIDFTAYYGPGYNYKGTLEIRIGTANGKVIGQTELGYFNKDKDNLQRYTIKTKSLKGVVDLFLVFKNEADKSQYVCNANAIQFNY